MRVEKEKPLDPAMLTVNQAAAMTGLSVRTVWRRVDDRTFPQPVRLGNCTRWSRARLEQWIADKSRAANEQADAAAAYLTEIAHG